MGKFELAIIQFITLRDSAVCGFVSQEPWFINATLKENIIFGMEEDEKKYNEAIRISGLTRDFLSLSLGDESFVFDLNLTPSQKQRLSLARCIYHCPDIILMEDILSDFDQTQARQLFREGIKNRLKKNTCVVMLTQQKQFLPDCDRIVVMKGGKVVEIGTYSELKKRNVNFSAWVTDVVHIDDDPKGIIDNVSEIRLDPPTTSIMPAATSSASSISPLRVNDGGGPQSISGLRNGSENTIGSNVGSFSHLQQIRRKSMKARSSPLASSVINAEGSPLRQIKQLNSTSVQNAQLNEITISKMIERSQNSVLTGNSTRPPANFANQDLVSRTIEANSLTVHSLHEYGVGRLQADAAAAINDPITNTITGDQADISDQFTSPYLLFFRHNPGPIAGLLFLFLFVSSHAFRFVSDVWIMYLINEPQNYNRNIIIFGVLSLTIVVSILLRGYGFLTIIVSKGASWHNKILNVRNHYTSINFFVVCTASTNEFLRRYTSWPHFIVFCQAFVFS